MLPRPAGGRSAHVVRALVLVAVVVCCGAAAVLRPFTVPVEVAVAVAIAGTAGLAAAGRPGPRPPAMEEAAPARPPTWANAWPWLALFGALAGWELAAFFSSPRHDHPTISSMLAEVINSYPGRAALIAAWLSLGWVLFLRPGRSGGRPGSPPARARP